MKVFTIMFLGILISACSKPDYDIKSQYYKKLDDAVLQKKDELTRYFDIVSKSLEGISADGPLIESFFKLNEIFLAEKHKREKPGVASLFDKLDQDILSAYIDRFMIFNDLLFINLEGDVFYTLKKQKLLLQNIFSDEYKDTALSKSLQKNPLSSAVDFDVFSTSDPSAFFVYPVQSGDKLIGWCAFQFFSGNLDTLFSVEKNIGVTGEVFLVNENSYMLTNSNFSPESSILKQHLADDNIKPKFAAGKGHKEVIDYRGYKVISSFEVCSVFNLNWLLVAKMDYAEVLSAKYLSNSKVYYDKVRSYILNRKNKYIDEHPEIKKENVVNLDQFKRVVESGSLYTHGVSSCTGVLITLPGKFSYLAHISAYDFLYGGLHTDLVGNMLKRINKFEIPEYMMREVKVFIITPKILFSKDFIDILIKQKILLSQIYLVKNQNAKYANIYHDFDSNATFVEWKLPGREKTELESVESIPSIAEIIESIEVE